VYSDGLAEYEACGDGSVAVTLVRAVGALSRNDLPERPGHAGWPTPTPGAQCLGQFAGGFAVLLHGERDDATIDLIERTADDVLLPLAGGTLRSALELPSLTRGIELHGTGLAFSAAKESEDGEQLVLRTVNLLERPVEGTWRLGVPVREAWLARLDEMPESPLAVRDGEIRFTAPPRGVVTVIAR
jgi:alpha-mannosidase